MTAEVEISVRGPEAYILARRAVEQMEAHQVWPTPLNFELWLHYVGNPEGALGQEIQALLKAGETIIDSVSEMLAHKHLPRFRLNDEIRDAGDRLSAQLESVARAVETAQRSSAAYGKTLDGAQRQLDDAVEPLALQRLVEGLSVATQRVQRENATLQDRLQSSTEEVRRLREHLEQVRRDAMTDALTNLANRKAFDEGLNKFCQEAEGAGRTVTLAVIDIDHFKRFNDTWGHQTGDQVLRYVANVIGRVGEPPRLAARYGGEEFAILFPGERAAKVAKMLDGVREEISSRLLKRRSTHENLGAVTVSMGVAELHAGEPPASLVERADAALYVSKRTGRNRVTNAELARKSAVQAA